MPKPMPLSDFRAVRVILEDDDFALVPDNPNRPPFDLIEKETWDSIVTLPDDLSFRTSNDYGRLLKSMDRCWGAWIDSLEMRRDPIEDAILDAADEFHAATYAALHGFYRQAFGCLRNALPDGRPRYWFKAPWRNSTTHAIFEPLQFIERLTALVTTLSRSRGDEVRGGLSF